MCENVVLGYHFVKMSFHIHYMQMAFRGYAGSGNDASSAPGDGIVCCSVHIQTSWSSRWGPSMVRACGRGDKGLEEENSC